MGIAPQVDDDARHFAEVAKKFGEASMSDNGLTAGEQAQLFAISKIGNEVSHQLESWLSPWGNANVDLGIGYAIGEPEINIYLVWWLVCIHWKKRR